MEIYRYLLLHIKIICRRFRIITSSTFWDIHIWDILILKVCLQWNMLKSSLLFKKNTKLKYKITREFLGLRMLNFHCIIFTKEVVVQTCSVKKVFLDISQNLQESTCPRDSFLKKFIKKETLAQVFSYEFCEISKNIVFIEHLWWLFVTKTYGEILAPALVYL